MIISFYRNKNAKAFLLRDAHHAMHDAYLCNPAGGYMKARKLRPQWLTLQSFLSFCR